MRFRNILLALAALPTLAQAAWTLRYDGPDEITLMSRPNGAATNTRTARVERRSIQKLEMALLLAPAFETALAHCNMSDVDEIVLTPVAIPDNIGETTTHLQGIGMYVSLPLADRVSEGTWYLAPYASLRVDFTRHGATIDSAPNVFKYSRWNVSREREMTDEQFFHVRTPDLEDSIFAFANQTMPAAMKDAFPKRCG